jgi:hypothetical protein
MRSCLQSDTQNVLEHGHAVHKKYLELLDDPPECLIPWWGQLIKAIKTFSTLDIYNYHVYHDCGKPDCLVIEDGRRHFPNHAAASCNTWLAAGGDALVAVWILHDMDLHVCSAQELDRFAYINGCEVLLLTALAEIQANAELFGGQDSQSYKIKYKHWLRRATAFCKRRYQ